MNKKRAILTAAIIAVLVISVFLFSSFNKKTVAESTKVRFAYLPIVWNLPLYAAVDKGYFKDAEIEVEMIQFQSPNQMIDGIMSGQVDFTAPGGPLGIPAIADYKNPGKMKVYNIAGEESENATGDDIIIPIDSEIKSIGELKGKKLGIPAGTIQWKIIAREILALNGLDMDKDVTVIELAPAIQVQAISSKQVDAMLALEPIPTISVNKGVAKTLVKGADKLIANPMWAGAGVVSTDFAADNPKTTKKVISILQKAMTEVNDNFDANRQYLPNYTSLPSEIVNKVPAVNYKNYDAINEKDRESIQKFFDLFTKYGVVDGKIDLKNILYSPAN